MGFPVTFRSELIVRDIVAAALAQRDDALLESLLDEIEETPASYVWGAGHAAELAYLWPSFDNGTPIAPTFDAGERRLARDMVRYWGSFVRDGRPAAASSAAWARYDRTGQTLSLRAGGRSALISDSRLAAEHQCGF